MATPGRAVPSEPDRFEFDGGPGRHKSTAVSLSMCLKISCALALIFTCFYLPCFRFGPNSIDSHHEALQLERKRAQTEIVECLIDDPGNEFAMVYGRIQELKDDVRKIISYTTKGAGKGTTYDELALFVDTFGPRMSGSPALERAVEYLQDKMRNEGRLNVTAEPVTVPHWEMLSQSCEITQPAPHQMNILTLGQSVSTNGTLEAPVVVVHDFDDLLEKSSTIGLRGKIVVFNYKWISYSVSVKYRTQGASMAARVGAVAALIRSVTDFSINSPHTGSGSKSIPTAAITVEDANFIERLLKRNQTVRIKLNIQTKHHPDAQSFNLVGDIQGESSPEEVVFVSGHMDSWYPTSGAMDDAGGMMISYKALEVLNKLGLRARRTMRAVLFTAEEPGLVGASQYFNNHSRELHNFKAVIESDLGTFSPLGLGYKNLGELGKCVVRAMLRLTEELGTTKLSDKYEGSDIELFSDKGVPALSLLNENSRYFYFHHTAGDSLDLEDPAALDRSTALFASTLYVLANLHVDLRE